MKKIVLTYGLIAGGIVSLWMGISMLSGCQHLDSNWGMFLGFTGMIIAFSFIFVAVKNYRDKFNGGSISFGRAFRIGLFISLIASTMYVVTWLFEYNFVMPDFMDKYAAEQIENLRQAGASAAEIQKTTEEMAWYRKMYKNPFFNAAMTYTEILPVGLLISLITALLLKKRPQMEA